MMNSDLANQLDQAVHEQSVPLGAERAFCLWIPGGAENLEELMEAAYLIQRGMCSLFNGSISPDDFCDIANIAMPGLIDDYLISVDQRLDQMGLLE